MIFVTARNERRQPVELLALSRLHLVGVGAANPRHFSYDFLEGDEQQRAKELQADKLALMPAPLHKTFSASRFGFLPRAVPHATTFEISGTSERAVENEADALRELTEWCHAQAKGPDIARYAALASRIATRRE